VYSLYIVVEQKLKSVKSVSTDTAAMVQGMALRKISTVVLLFILILNQLSLYSQVIVQEGIFVLQSYGYKSSANTNTIYPGSRNIIVTTNIVYNGSAPIRVSAGCINLPQGFSTSRGFSSCSPPQAANGTTHTIVYPGDVIVFNYHIDIDSSVVPGTHKANITIYYRLPNSTESFTAVVTGITITVSPYPPPQLAVVDWYWSPDAYPGSQGVYLYITLRNTGNATFVQVTGEVELPQNTFFYTQPANRFQILGLSKNQATVVSIGPVSIYPNASPHIVYSAAISFNATMSTDDNVIYYVQGNASFHVTISPAPSVNIQVIDYGIETPKPVQGIRQTRFYLIIRNMDFKNIMSVTAYFTIKTPSASFTNSSKTSVTVLQQVLSYGDVAAIYSKPIMINSTDNLTTSVKLVMFGDNNGAEFWSEQNYTFAVKLEAPTLNLNVLEVYWTPSEVYPGTEDALLNIVLHNYDVVDLRDAVVTVTLPQGFYPRQITVSDVGILKGSATTVAFSAIAISTSTASGEYPVKLLLSGVAWDSSSNTYYTVSLTFTVSVKVFEKPCENILALVSYGWVGGRAYITTVSASTYLYFQVMAPGYKVSNPRMTIYLPKQMIFESGNRSTTITAGGVYSYGQYFDVEIGGIDIVATESGNYPVVVKVEGLATVSGSYWFTQYFTLLLHINNPALNVTVIDFGWQSNPVGMDSSGAEMYITLQSLSVDTIRTTVVELHLLNARFLNGLNTSVQVLTSPIGYGEIGTVRFSEVELSNKTLYARVMIFAVLSLGRGAYYRAVAEYNLVLSSVESLEVFRVASLHTSVGGVYAPLLPSARGVSIVIGFANAKSVQVAWVIAEAAASKELKVNDISGTCANGVVAGGVCTVVLNVDVSPDASAGVAEVVVNLTYSVRSGATISLFRESHRVGIPIADYKYYRPTIVLASAYWGAQTPYRALVGQRNVAFTLTLTNMGYYPIEAVVVRAGVLKGSAIMVKNSDVCSAYLAPGASCSVTLYVDLGPVDRGGMIVFSVAVEYMFTQFSTAISDAKQFTIYLPVEEPATGKGLELVDASWSNNWPVYPNTENATLVITLVNRWPYRVSGMDVELLLPQGFSTKWGSVAKAYVAGPVNSLQQIAVPLQLSVGDIKPGRYTAKLLVRYVVESGTPDTFTEEELNISLVVNDLSSSVEVVNVYWVLRSPQPPEYGALLTVVVRNNYNPAMKGVVMDVELPPGIVSADTNTSSARVPATATNILQQIQVARISPSQLSQLLSLLLTQQAQVQTGFSYGDLMYFYLKLNIITNKTGVFTVNAIINFVDQWNNVRKVPLNLEVSILGSARIIDVAAPTSITIRRGVANVSIGLINKGSAPLYNVYIYLAPYVAMLIPQQAVKYVDVLHPYELTNVSFTLVYNPLAVSMGTTQTYLRYMSVPFSLSIVYRDVYGNIQAFNTSLAFILEPFIELLLTEVKASGAGSTIIVSGTIVNYGIATARSVVVKAVYSGVEQETLIGDVDPASQSSFRLEMEVSNIANNTLLLQLAYRDEYGRISTLNYTIPIIIRRVEVTPTVPQQQGVVYNYILVIGLATAFLTVIGLALYKYIKARTKALEKVVAEVAKN
jgi:hypothetical protein